MARGSGSSGFDQETKTGAFFMATLVMWAVSVFFEIVFNKRHELVSIVLGFVFFQFANWVLRRFLSRDPLFVNTSVSLLHSSITSAAGTYRAGGVTGSKLSILWDRVVSIMVNKWMTSNAELMFEHSQLVEHTWHGAYAALCVSCGYFAYDQWDMLLYRLYSGLIPAILVHHLLLLLCFTLALYRNVTINYLILTLICEMHSVFLHVRKVRRMAGFRDARSRIVKVEWFLNWTTFILARCTSHGLITIKLISDASKFQKGVELPLALFGMFGMHLLNVFLGIDLLKAYKRERTTSSHHNHHD